MKRFVFLVMMVAAVMFSLSIAPCEAKDVWVDRWQNSNADIYVMDETLAWEENLNGKFFRVTTKEVQNGKVKRFITHGRALVLLKPLFLDYEIQVCGYYERDDQLPS